MKKRRVPCCRKSEIWEKNSLASKNAGHYWHKHTPRITNGAEEVTTRAGERQNGQRSLLVEEKIVTIHSIVSLNQYPSYTTGMKCWTIVTLLNMRTQTLWERRVMKSQAQLNSSHHRQKETRTNNRAKEVTTQAEERPEEAVMASSQQTNAITLKNETSAEREICHHACKTETWHPACKIETCHPACKIETNVCSHQDCSTILTFREWSLCSVHCNRPGSVVRIPA